MVTDVRQASTPYGFMFLRVCVGVYVRKREKMKINSLGQSDVSLWGNYMFSQAVQHAFYYITTFICKYKAFLEHSVT